MAQKTIKGLWQAALMAAVMTAVVNLILYFIGKNFLSVPFLVPVGPNPTTLTELDFIMITVASVVPSFIAAGGLRLLDRITAQPVKFFWGVAVGVLIISFIPFFTFPETVAIRTQLVLGTMHVLSAGIITLLLTRTVQKN